MGQPWHLPVLQPAEAHGRLVQDILGLLPKELPDESLAYIKKMCHYTCYGERGELEESWRG